MAYIKKNSAKVPWIVDNKTTQSQSPTSNYDFYNSYAWRQYCKRFKKLFPLCIASLHKGLIEPTKIVDHIIPVNQGGSLMDTRNHQPLSHEEHQKKRGKESHGKIEQWCLNAEGDKIPARNKNMTLDDLIGVYTSIQGRGVSNSLGSKS